MFSTITNFILLLIGFGLVIFVHELGHFMFAKWVGIKVEQFAIGFGTAAMSWRKGIGVRLGSTKAACKQYVAAGKDPELLGETEYRLNWFPLGGYVKMLGQDDLDMAAGSDDPKSYTSKPVWARMLVVSAGVVMNVIFAVILFMICFMWGVQFEPPVIGMVDPASGSAYAVPTNGAEYGIDKRGILPGDRVLSINGDKARHFKDIQMGAAIARAGKPLNLEVRREIEREGEVSDVTLEFNIEPKPSQDDRLRGLLELGVFPTNSNRIQTDDEILNDERMQRYLHNAGLGDAGVERGMALIEAGGKPITDHYWKMRQAAIESQGQPIDVVFADVVPEVAGAAVPPSIPLSESNATIGSKRVRGVILPTPELMVEMVEHEEMSLFAPHLLGLCPAVVIAEVARDSAKEAGIKSGDIIARVGTTVWPSYDQVFSTIRSNAGNDVKLVLIRDGEQVTLDAPVSSEGTVGIGLEVALSTNIVTRMIDYTSPISGIGESDSEGGDASENPAEEPDTMTFAASISPAVMPGSKVISINGDAVSDWREIVLALRRHTDVLTDGPVALEVEFELPTTGGPVDTAEWILSPDEIETVQALGWDAGAFGSLFAPARITIRADGPIDAIWLGVDETKRMLYLTYLTIDRLFRRSVKVEHLKGPVGIAEIGTKVASQGLPYLIMFLAIISVNLAVLNFLPIPIVDGGLFLFLVVEKIKGSPVSERVQSVATIIGLLMIGTLFLVTFYNDVASLIR
jgi:regulator of sigma E protease